MTFLEMDACSDPFRRTCGLGAKTIKPPSSDAAALTFLAAAFVGNLAQVLNTLQVVCCGGKAFTRFDGPSDRAASNLHGFLDPNKFPWT